MLGREGALVTPLRIVLGLLSAVTALCFFTAQAQAAPGAYRVLLAEVYEDGAKRLQAQVAAFPDVAKVDLVDTSERTPSAAELRAYDVVVSIGDNLYDDEEAWGNSLADYVDTGGIVIQAAYDTWEDEPPSGRWETGDYAPFIPGPTANEITTLGAFDASNPLMQGFAPGALYTDAYNTENQPTPGATVIANWADGRPAIAVKGRVVAITAFIGDAYDGPGDLAWTGNYGQLVVNAARAFAPQPPAPHELTVVNSNPLGGTVTSTAGGISCGAICSAKFTYGAQVGLTAVANEGFAFTGFTGACAGTACALTMHGAKSVAANFTAFKFGKKVKRNKKQGTAVLTVNVGGPGALAVGGKRIKKRRKTANAAGDVKLPIVPKGKALKALRATGKAKVKVELAYTPTGGTTSTLTRKVQLKLSR